MEESWQRRASRRAWSQKLRMHKGRLSQASQLRRRLAEVPLLVAGPVPMVDLKAQYEQIREEVDAATARVLAAAQFIKGEDCGLFEAELLQLTTSIRVSPSGPSSFPDQGPVRASQGRFSRSTVSPVSARMVAMSSAEKLGR